MEHFNIISKKLLCRSSYCFCHKTNAGLDSPVRSDTVAIQICFCCRYGSEHDYRFLRFQVFSDLLPQHSYSVHLPAQTSFLQFFSVPSEPPAFSLPLLPPASSDPLMSQAFSLPLMSQAFSLPLMPQAFSDPLILQASSDPMMLQVSSVPLMLLASSDPLMSQASSLPLRSQFYSVPV